MGMKVRIWVNGRYRDGWINGAILEIWYKQKRTKRTHLEKPIDFWRRRIDDDDQVDEFIRNCNGGRWIKHYCSSHRILLVGEGNFSFSACLANAFGLAYNMVATSLDSPGFLAENYKDALSNILLLLNRGCNVIHGVDATTAAHHYALTGMRFDRIVFNFPLAGFDKSLPRSEQIKRNQMMLLYFFANAQKMLSYAGEVHVVHKTNGFFQEWEIEKLALQSGFHLIEQSDFNLNDYPGYSNKYGYGGDKDFDWRPSNTYKFGFLVPKRDSFSLGYYHPALWPDVEPTADEVDDFDDFETPLVYRAKRSYHIRNAPYYLRFNS